MSAYTYRAVLTRVVDGDTVDLSVDLGFGIYKRDRFRVLGINCPETRYRRKGLTDEEWEAEKVAGRLASEYACTLLGPWEDFTIETHKDDQGKYGRYLCSIILPDGRDYGLEMINAGHAVAAEY